MKALAPALLLLLSVAPCGGQKIIRPYVAPEVAPARQTTSRGLLDLLRAGSIYLTLNDAIRLALTNDPDIEAARYGPQLARYALRRAEAGGAIRGVPSGAAQVSAVDSGLGANGSTAAAGLGGGGNGGNGSGNGGGATVQQVGQITPNLDPNLQNATAFSHQTEPQANTTVSGTNALIQAKHTYNTVFQQGLISGGAFGITDYEQSLRENAPTDVINPAVGPFISVSLRHSLLRGFGVGLNNRFIRIARINLAGARETFRAQLIDSVTQVASLYWDLASAREAADARRQTLDLARKFLEDTRARIEVGSLARVELPRAEAEVAARGLEFEVAQATARDRENRLKAELNGGDDPAVEAAAIIPLDRMQVPAADDLVPLPQMIGDAMRRRPDAAIAKIRDETLALGALGTVNPLLPSLSVNLQAYDRGSAGQYQPTSGARPNPSFLGGYGTALGQIARRDFPSETASLSFFADVGNHSAQADYGIDQLQLRQTYVAGKRDANNIAVAISNEVIALRQARVRYSAASETRTLQGQLLEAEQQKFSFGKSQSRDVILAQRALAASRISELDALAAWVRARVSLDQVLGQTLEVNQVSVDDALAAPGGNP